MKDSDTLRRGSKPPHRNVHVGKGN